MIKCEFEDGNKAGLRHVTVSVIIVKNGKVLLGKRGTHEGKIMLESGKWDTIGGYVDRDETTIQTAEREVMEETGWKIKNIKLFRINDNPDRPFEDRQNIEFCYFAEAVEKVGEGDEEISELRWFDFDNLPPASEIAFDHWDNLELYKRYLKKPRGIPIVGNI